MVLSSHKVLLCKHNLLSFKSKVENQSDVARVGQHEGEVLLAHTGLQPDQEAFGVGGGEPNVDTLSNSGFVLALEVVFNHHIGSHIYSNFISTYRSLERCPSAVASEVIITLDTFTIILARTVFTLSFTSNMHPVQTMVLCHLINQVNRNTVKNQSTQTAYITISPFLRSTNIQSTG